MPEPVEKAKGAAEGGKNALGHKVGPLPLWGWAVAGVVAVVIAKKLGGGGGGAAPGIVTIPGPGAGASPTDSGGGPPPIVSPSQNNHGGSDTAPGGAPPWWATPPAWWNATQHAGAVDHPSTNGSGGSGADKTPTDKPKDVAAGGSWWSKLLNPSGALPAGAAVTTIGGVTYSLSSDALARAGITGASAPPAGAAQPVGTTTSAPTGTTDPNGNPWVSKWGGIGAGPARTDIQGVAPPPPKPGEAGYKGWAENNL